MITRPKTEDLNGGLAPIDNYQNSNFELSDWELTAVVDNILVVQYADANEDGTEIKRGNLVIPINVAQHTWRVGKVLMAGPEVKNIKENDYVIFPNDKGIKVANLNGLKNIVFLDDKRIFGVCKPKK